VARSGGTPSSAASLNVISQAKVHAHDVHDMDLSEEQATSMARPA